MFGDLIFNLEINFLGDNPYFQEYSILKTVNPKILKLILKSCSLREFTGYFIIYCNRFRKYI